jgi:deoxyadenosine/deoxycytidine kinase
MTILATIQGNIGSGKSTLIESLRSKYEDNTNICFLPEPVDEWQTIKDKDNVTMLALFYANQKRYAFSFQMMAYISRLCILKKALTEGYDIIISERSLSADKNIFAKMLYDDGNIEEVEYQIYLKWFDSFQPEFPTEHIIYILTDPLVAKERIELRGREGEVIPFEYLCKCDKYHNDWISAVPHTDRLNLDGNLDVYKTPAVLSQWEGEIIQFLYSIDSSCCQSLQKEEK